MYKIPESNMRAFEEKIQTLSKKAEKLNCEKISFRIENKETVEETKTLSDGTVIKTGFMLSFFNVSVVGEAPKFDGWEFVAVIEKVSDAANYVAVLPGQNLPEKFRSCELTCEHCNIVRFRKKYYVVHKESDYKLVGSSCLKDFLGHNSPENIASAAELFSSLDSEIKEFEDRMYCASRLINLNTYLSYVAAAIRLHGWVSKSKCGLDQLPTASIASSEMFKKKDEPKLFTFNAQDIETAKKSIEWATSLADEDKVLSDFEHNMSILARAEALPDRATGTAAAIVASYLRTLNLTETVSAHVGNIGDKIEVTVTVTAIFPIQGNYGTTYIHTMKDASKNVFKWFTGKTLPEGVVLSLKGTVKNHSEFRGQKETILTRCKVL